MTWQTVCGWCGKHVRGPKDAPLISHSICKECFDRYIKDIQLIPEQPAAASDTVDMIELGENGENGEG